MLAIMKKRFGISIRSLLGLVAVVLSVASLQAADVRSLDVADQSVEKSEVRHSMIGPRSTLVFYAFPEQQAVLVVNVDNKSTKFPVNATVNLFDKTVTADGLAKWINNQHSDGLYPDVPAPLVKFPIPAASCETVSHKILNRAEKHSAYEVEYKIGEVKKEGVFELKAFSATTQVLVKIE